MTRTTHDMRMRWSSSRSSPRSSSKTTASWTLPEHQSPKSWARKPCWWNRLNSFGRCRALLAGLCIGSGADHHKARHCVKLDAHKGKGCPLRACFSIRLYHMVYGRCRKRANLILNVDGCIAVACPEGFVACFSVLSGGSEPN